MAEQHSSAADADLSTSVHSLNQRLGQDSVTPWQIVTALLASHEYGGDRSQAEAALAGDPPAGASQPLGDWLAAIRPLYQPQPEGRLDGRKLILGLALLDPVLQERLDASGLLPALEAEIDDLDDALSELGRASRLADHAPTVTDRDAKEDALRRLPFAHLLAQQMIDEYQRTTQQAGGPDSLMFHLDGAWGSGKSTLLNLIEAELKQRDPPWLVARFNAWRHQRIGPPWWLLIKVIYRHALEAEGLSLRERAGLWAENAAWRLALAWHSLAAAAIAIGVLAALGVTGRLSTSDPLGVAVGAISAVSGAILSIRGLASGLSVGSASTRGADLFVRSTRDPMGTLRRRHQALVKRITERIGRPLVVFIDDLDRCQSEYVIQLLEGIQTTLRDAPIAYIVAAERRWLYDSYREEYAGHDSSGTDPGRPLGHLFLEKSFQLSAPIPRLGPVQRGAFLQHLATPTQQPLSGNSAGVVSGPPADLQKADQADFERRARAVEQLGTPAGTRTAEHYLSRFAHLLEPNPRAIKRLLNSYRPALALEILEGRSSANPGQKDQFVLWLIVNLRWPLLAEYLAERPEAADELAAPGNQAPEAITGDETRPYLARLARDSAVRRVMRGEGVGTPLTTGAIKRLLGEERDEAEPTAASS